jgi:hypothetical protein
MKYKMFEVLGVCLILMVAFSGSVPSTNAAPSIGLIHMYGAYDYQTLLNNLGLSYTLISSSFTLSDLTSYNIIIFDGYGSLSISDTQAGYFVTAFNQGTSFFLSIDDISSSSNEEAIFRTLLGASDFADSPETSTPTILASQFPNGCPTNSQGRILNFGQGDQEYVTCSSCTILDNSHEIVIRQGGCAGVLYLGDTIESVSDLSATGVLGTLFKAFYDCVSVCNTTQRHKVTMNYIPLAQTNITKANGLLTQVNSLLSDAKAKNLDTATCEKLIDEAKADLTEAKMRLTSPTTANYFALRAAEKLKAALDCLKALLG